MTSAAAAKTAGDTEPVGGGKNPLAELLDAEEARLVSCLPPQLPRRGFDVYVTRRTNFPAQLQRCRRLLRRPPHLCWVHGLGAAVPRAANLALQLSDELAAPPVVYTSTVECTDRLMAALEQSEAADVGGGGGGGGAIRRRFKSALHIRLEAAAHTVPPQSG